MSAPTDGPQRARVLIVAHRTAATPALLDAVRERAGQGPAQFTLLVPNQPRGLHRVVDPEDTDPKSAGDVLEEALPALSDAAGSQVAGMIGDPSPLTAVEDAIHAHGFDEIIVSTLPTTVSKWLRLDLPHKCEGFGLPVTTVTAQETARAGVAG